MVEPLPHLAAYKRGAADMPARMGTYLRTLRELDTRQREAEDECEAAALSAVQEIAAAGQGGPGSSRKKRDRDGTAAANAAAVAARAHKEAGLRVDAGHATVLQLSEDKVKLAQSMYDYVDDKIAMLEKQSAELLQKVAGEQERLGLPEGQSARDVLGLTSLKDAKTKVKALMRKKSYATAEVVVIPGEGAIIADQREPTYCYCQRVSFGDMVACDNLECPIEWFHYECVGLPPDFNPEGQTWLCKECRAAQGAAVEASTATGSKQ